jgi:hypothetical protein
MHLLLQFIEFECSLPTEEGCIRRNQDGALIT